MESIFDILDNMRQNKCSDLYLRVGDMIAYRQNGEILFLNTVCNLDMMQDILSKKQIESYVSENTISEDLDFSLNYGGRYRINSFMSNGKQAAVIRIINDNIIGFKELGIGWDIVESIVRKKGFSIIAGKTCSGKTTTLASIVEYINKNYSFHILTLEDPIEITFTSKKSRITQRELNRDFFSYSDAIKSSLRQSPDILVIGEIRDRETMKLAVEASESGVAVLCTLHSVGSVKTISKILSFFSANEREFILEALSNELNFIQSQKLERDSTSLNLRLNYELMRNNRAISNLIRQNELNQIESQIIMNKSLGMKLFDS